MVSSGNNRKNKVNGFPVWLESKAREPGNGLGEHPVGAAWPVVLFLRRECAGEPHGPGVRGGGPSGSGSALPVSVPGCVGWGAAGYISLLCREAWAGMDVWAQSL